MNEQEPHSEHTSLLFRENATDNAESQAAKDSQRTALAVLPVALLAALAMAATAATTIYAYAYLLCKDPTHCKDVERSKYAGTVAGATTIANLCAMFAVGPLARLSKRSPKATLAVWLICRSMSVVVLALGVHMGNIGVAVSGQVFDGLASDNILHFSLNAIYVQAPTHQTVSRFIGSSLALYMIGISVSPTIAGLLENFRASFFMASAFFVVALLYLLIVVPRKREAAQGRKASHQPRSDDKQSVWSFGLKLLKTLRTTVAPLVIFRMNPLSVFPALALLFYNAIQSYTFSAIMVHTSLEFGFSGRENGFLISIAHAVAATYLLLTLLLVPMLVHRTRATKSKKQSQDLNRRSNTADVPLALVSLLTQACSLLLFGLATKRWEVYAITALCALGLSTPSFIKSYFVTLYSRAEGPKALAALAMMETFGSLIAPMMLGGLQTALPGKSVFLVASGCVFGASLIFLAGLITPRPPHR